MAAALREQVARDPALDREVAAFYRARAFAPLWAPGRVRPEALRLAQALAEAGEEAPAEDLRHAPPDDPWRLAELELRLSAAYAAHARRPSAGGGLEFVDPLLVKADGRGRRALEAAAKADPLDAHLAAALTARNPLHAEFERGLELYLSLIHI